MIFLGHISQRSSELMFLRMPGPDQEAASPASSINIPAEELEQLAQEFSQHIPPQTFTHAQLQGYLLNCRDSPREVLKNIESWVKEEVTLIEAAKEKEKRRSEQRN
ncbi:uncharacterized protein CTHT_0072730 [Thermochaetoides thermophila DSM 1495]|jgi:hypothetical protein|uniref:Mitochondrial chaperone BCS1-like ATPase lid domain-containing protein n=1 Tax=Chaetomium thermophilum (strain DSM 1495 / CBS 144.50 / IMI 039719) TaxID=759272 RepID=G0SFZ8_CHATD|nr:hypothetical protein CTHT_0072730 [Thermochaetoides thermophila DSM 1495]EGS17913.1 hypothetical protein CTHT_0072730 [Thermochaetoides thermophila DSM 1495]